MSQYLLMKRFFVLIYLVINTFFCSTLLFAQAVPEGYDEAFKLYLKGDYKESLARVRAIFEANKTSMELRLLAAANYIELNEFNQASAHISVALQTNPKRSEPILFQANLLRRQGKLNKALRNIDRALPQIKEQTALFLEIAILHLQNNNRPLARVYMQRALERDPKNIYAFYIDGLIFLKDKQYESAEFRFRNALALKPIEGNLVVALSNNLGFCIEKKANSLLLDKNHNIENVNKIAKGLYKEARFYYKQAIKISPNSNTTLANLERISNK